MCDDIGIDESYTENQRWPFERRSRLNQNNETEGDFMFAIRKVVRDYGCSCERLLSKYSFDSPLSQEEVAFIQYYMDEMGKRFDGLFSKLEVSVGRCRETE
jgi:hypothetical protein